MKNYKKIVNRQFKSNKKRNIYTIVGVILAVSLFSTILYINTFIRDVNIANAKASWGSYDIVLKNLNSEQENAIKSNILINKYSFINLENSGSQDVNGYNREIFVYGVNKDTLMNLFKDKIKLVDGHFATNDKEIVIENSVLEELHKKIGDNLVVGNKTYKIVGSYSNSMNELANISCLTYFNRVSNKDDLIAAIELKGSDKMENIQKLCTDLSLNSNYDSTEVYYNNALLGAEGYSSEKYDSNIEEIILTIVLNAIIVVITTILIYGSINTSMKEKIKLFSMLRCIGATPSKIRALLIRESFIIGAIAIIPGIILGDLISRLIIDLTFKKLLKINCYGVNLGINLKNIFWVILLTSITIFIASIVPIIRAGKIQPIEASKNINTNKGSKNKKSKVIKKIFGFKGELAYKNIRANNKSFILTSLVLSIVFITFVVVTSFLIILNKAEKNRATVPNKENYISINGYFNDANNIKNEINSTNGTNGLITYLDFGVSLAVKDFNVNNIIKDKIVRGNDTIIENAKVYVYDDAAFDFIKSRVESNGINLSEFNKNGVILINNKVKNGYFKSADEPILNAKIGSDLDMYLLKDRDSKEVDWTHPVNMKVIGTIDKQDIIAGSIYPEEGQFGIIISKSFFENNKVLFDSEQIRSRSYVNVGFNFTSQKSREANLAKIKQYSNFAGGRYVDNFTELSEQLNSLFAIGLISYAMLFVTIIIVMINIINNKNIDISSRKNDFGTMLAIGMNRKALRKIIFLEGIIQWLIPTIFSIVISVVGLKIIYLIFMGIGDLNSAKVDLWIIIVPIIVTFIINVISSLICVKRFDNIDINSMMRSEE